MGASSSKQSNSRTLGSLLRFPQLQKDLKKIYKAVHPGKSEEDIRKFVRSLTNETRIRTVIEQLELEVFGRDSNGKPNVMGGNDLPARVDRLKRKVF